MRRLLATVVFVAAALAVGRADDSVKLILRDGRVLEGTDVWREQGNYYLKVNGGGVVPIPEPLVESVALSGSGTPELEPAPGSGPVEPATRPPAQLAGAPVEAPRTSQQLRALGPSAQFQPGVVDPYWRPTSDWKDDGSDPNRNDFAPSSWAESVVDSDWKPKSAFTKDHTQFAPSQWQPDVIDSGWTPQDGFRTSPGSSG